MIIFPGHRVDGLEFVEPIVVVAVVITMAQVVFRSAL